MGGCVTSVSLSCPRYGVKVITDSASEVQRLRPAQGKCPTSGGSADGDEGDRPTLTVQRLLHFLVDLP